MAAEPRRADNGVLRGGRGCRWRGESRRRVRHRSRRSRRRASRTRIGFTLLIGLTRIGLTPLISEQTETKPDSHPRQCAQGCCTSSNPLRPLAATATLHGFGAIWTSESEPEIRNIRIGTEDSEHPNRNRRFGTFESEQETRTRSRRRRAGSARRARERK